MFKNKTILITGGAGFIGSAVSAKLLERGENVIGIDNHNDYYDPKIKDARLARLTKFSNYKHYRADLKNKNIIVTKPEVKEKEPIIVVEKPLPKKENIVKKNIVKKFPLILAK